MPTVKFTTDDVVEVWRGSSRLFRGRLAFWVDATPILASAAGTGGANFTFKYPNKVSKAYGILASQGPAPATPTGLVLEDATAGFVALAWDNAGDATQWTVYRDGVSKGTTSNASFTDSTVVPSHADYSYQVQASNAAGASALSPALLVTTPANSLPLWVLGGQALILNVGFSLNLSSYADDSDGHTLTFTKTSGSVPGLSLVGSTYSGAPTAVGAYPVVFDVFDGYDHVSSGTITFTVSDPDVTAPTVPGSVVASVNGSTVTVTWNASTDASGILRYRVFRGGTFRANADASPYVETGVPVGSYTYSVSAVDASANANESAQGSAPPVSVIPQNPDTPINFTATAASSSQINLAWAAGPNGVAPDDYDVDWSLTGTGGWTAVVPDITTAVTTYQHTGRTASTRYYYRVRANKSGATSSGYATANALTTTVQSGTIFNYAGGPPGWASGFGQSGSAYTSWSNWARRYPDTVIGMTSAVSNYGSACASWTAYDTGTCTGSSLASQTLASGTHFAKYALSIPQAMRADATLVLGYPPFPDVDTPGGTGDWISNKYSRYPWVWGRIAAGEWDSHYRTLATNFKNYLTSLGYNPDNLIVRMGHEMDGNWYSWCIGGSGASTVGTVPKNFGISTPTTQRLSPTDTIRDFKLAWARIVGLWREKIPGVRFDFSPSRCLQGYYQTPVADSTPPYTDPGGRTWPSGNVALIDFCPASAYFDFISRSTHDVHVNVPGYIGSVSTIDATTWNYIHKSTPSSAGPTMMMSLDMLVTTAIALNKPMSWPEWGCQMIDSGNLLTGDNSPEFLRQAFSWLSTQAAAGRFAYELYFSASYSSLHDRPTSSAAIEYKRLWAPEAW